MKAPDWIEDFNARARGLVTPLPPSPWTPGGFPRPRGMGRGRRAGAAKSLGFFVGALGAVYGLGILAGVVVHWLAR